MPKVPDLESKVINTGDGKDAKSSSQLNGGAVRTKAESAKNSPTKYDTGAAPAHGVLGGRNRR